MEIKQREKGIREERKIKTSESNGETAVLHAHLILFF